MFLTKAVPLPDFSASSMFSESNIKEDNRMPYHFFSKAKAFCCIIENCYNILNAFGVGCGNHLGHFDMVERKLFRLIPVVIVQCHVSPRPFQRPIERSRSFVHQPMQGDARPYGQPSHSLTASAPKYNSSRFCRGRCSPLSASRNSSTGSLSVCPLYVRSLRSPPFPPIPGNKKAHPPAPSWSKWVCYVY